MNSNNGPYLSASQRRIRDLENHITGLEAMRAEFFLLLNHLIKQNGGVYRLYKADLLLDGTPLIVKAIKGHVKEEDRQPEDACGDYIEWVLLEPPPEPASRIIT